MSVPLIKYVGEVKYQFFDYSQRPEIVAGDTIVSATVTQTLGPEDIDLDDPIIESPEVRVSMSGGTADSDYKFVCLATLAGGSVLQDDGVLMVLA